MGFTPTFDLSSLGVLLGTVGATGGVVSGNASIGPIGFTPLPGRTTADSFTSADVGRRITVMGAGPGGTLLITTVAAVADSQHVTLADAPSFSVSDGIAGVTIYRPTRAKIGSIAFKEDLTDVTDGEFTTQQATSGHPPVEGQPFLFTSDDPALVDAYGTFWGGEIDSIETSYAGFADGSQKWTETVCKCVSYKAVLQRRVMLGKQYSSTTVAAVVADVCSQATADYIDYTVPTDAAISLLTVDDYTYLDQVLDALTTLASSGATKYFWYMDHWRKVHMVTETSNPAPWSISDTGLSDGNVLVQVSKTRTREKLANQVYAKASKALGDLQTATYANSFNGSALPQPRRALTLPAKAGITPKITVNGVAKRVWVSPIDPRNDTGTVTIPVGYDWAWPEDTDYVFCDVSRPGIPSGGTGIVSFYPVGVAISHDLNTASVTQRSAVQGGSGLHEAVETVDAPMSKAELDVWVTGHVAAFGLVPESVNVETYRAGLRRGMGLTVHLIEIGATVNYIVESVSMNESQGYVHWMVKASIGAFIGDWTGSLIRALGGDTTLGGGAGFLSTGSVLAAQFVGGSGMLTVPYAAKVIVNGGTEPYTFAVAAGSSLPAGLTLDTVEGIINGTPTAIGTFNFTIAVLDSASESTTADCQIIVAAAPADGSAELTGTVTSLSASDNVSARWVDGPLHAQLDVTVFCNAYPKRVTLTTDSPQYGHVWHGWFRIATAGQVISLGAKGSNTVLFPPTAADETVIVRGSVGTYDKNIDLTTTPGYSPASVIVHAPGVYGSTGSSTASAPTLTYVPGPGKASMFVATLNFTLPLSDSKFWFARVCVKTGHYTTSGDPSTFVGGGANGADLFEGVQGTPIGDWAAPTGFIPTVDHSPIFQLVSTVAAGQIRGTWGPHNVPSDGNDVFRFFLYLGTRQDDGSGGTKTQQGTWPSGLIYYDFVVDGTRSKTDPTYTDTSKFGRNIKVNSLGQLDTTLTVGPNLLANPGAEQGTQEWTLTDNGLGMKMISGTSVNHTTLGSRCFEIDVIVNGASVQAAQSIIATPNRTYGFSAWLLADGGASFNIQLVAFFYNAAGSICADVGAAHGVNVVFGTNPPWGWSGWQRKGGIAIAPPDAAQVVFAVQLTCMGGTGNVHIDDLEAYLLPDTGAGAKLDAFGRVIPNLAGTSVGLNGSDQLIVPDGQIGNGHFVGGTLGADLSKWASTAIPYGFYFGLPSPTAANIPSVIINTAENPWRVYNKIGGGWQPQKTQPGDLIGGTITALISIFSPLISGGTISGITLSGSAITGGSLNISGSGAGYLVTVTIDGSSYIMVNSSNGTTQITDLLVRAQNAGGSRFAQLTASGSFAAQGPLGSVGLSPGGLSITSLPSGNPGAGSKQFWYDPTDGNRVKFAA